MFKRGTKSGRERDRHGIAPVPCMLYFMAGLRLPIIPDLKTEHVILWRQVVN